MTAAGRDLGVLRLLITPEGPRQINLDVLICTGDDCPSPEAILGCWENPGWPCR